MSNVIWGLNRIERLILILRHCENLQIPEIAEMLGLPVLLVEQTYLRVLKDQMRCVL